jgi:hypothetical protein
MGSDLEKSEKKRLKAQYKLEKKRAKQDEKLGSKETTATKGSTETRRIKSKPDSTLHQTTQEQGPPKVQQDLPWYKDPNWVRAIAAIVTMIVAIIALYFQFAR